MMGVICPALIGVALSNTKIFGLTGRSCIYALESCKQERGSEEFFTSSKARATNFVACNKNKKVLMICKPFKTPSLSLRILQQLHIMPSFKYKRHTKSEYYRQAGTLCVEMGFMQT